ncbi:MAG: hypothetical protein ACYSWQ_16955 [Planctomycetota bacterium]
MANRTDILLALGICLLVCASSAPAQDKQPLQYRFHREAKNIIYSEGRVFTKMTTDKPQGVSLPQFKSRTPFFTQWSTPMVPSGRLHIALDKTSEPGRWDRIFVDSDGDGHLSDEEAATAYLTERYETHFGPIKVVFEGENGPIDYHLNFNFLDFAEPARRLYISSACWREGEITVAGTERRCLLIDQNVNGTFNDKAYDAYEGDSIKFGRRGFGRRYVYPPGRNYVANYVDVGGTLYHPEIATDGSYIKLTRAENVKFGNVRMPETITYFETGGENGLFRIWPKQGSASLPVGKYRILVWVIERKDDQSQGWRLTGKSFPERGYFHINHAKQTPLSIGEPAFYLLGARKTEEGYSFRLELKGRLGERVGLSCNDRRAPAPKLHIRSKDGSYDRTFTFEYG